MKEYTENFHISLNMLLTFQSFDGKPRHWNIPNVSSKNLRRKVTKQEFTFSHSLPLHHLHTLYSIIFSSLWIMSLRDARERRTWKNENFVFLRCFQCFVQHQRFPLKAFRERKCFFLIFVIIRHHLMILMTARWLSIDARLSRFSYNIRKRRQTLENRSILWTLRTTRTWC